MLSTRLQEAAAFKRGAGASSTFTTSWVTSGVSEDIVLPLVVGGTYNFDVDWGDASGVDTITVYNQAEVTHTYATANTYTVSITGQIEGWAFDFGVHATKMLTLSEWGPLTLIGPLWFAGCDTLTITATDAPTITATDWESAFDGCVAITTIVGLGNWDTSGVTSFLYAFWDCTLFNEASIVNWTINTTTPVSMDSMFQYCAAFNRNISSWNVSQVTTMSWMFSNATIFNQPIGGWNVGNVTTMEGMFEFAPDFDQTLSSWDVTSVASMANMFDSAWNFFQDLGAWTVSALTDATLMFNDAGPSPIQYANLLIGWEAKTHNNTVTFDAGWATYDATGATARGVLVGTDGWTITDQGEEPPA